MGTRLSRSFFNGRCDYVVLFGLWLLCCLNAAEASPQAVAGRLAFGDLFFDRGEAYMAGQEHRQPHGEVTWSTTDRWLYTSEEDPFCYIHLVYDNWWFTSPNGKQHCAKEMAKKDCTMIKFVESPRKLEWFQYENTLTCIGMKHTHHEIQSGHTPWKRILTVRVKHHTLDRWLVSLFKDTNVVHLGSGYQQISPSYVDFGLYYTNGNFFNVDLEGGTRKWVHPHWLFLRKERTLDNIVANQVWYTPSKAWKTLVPLKNVTCDSIMTGVNRPLVFDGRLYSGTKEGKASALTMGDGVSLGTCPDHTTSLLYDISPPSVMAVDRSAGFLINAIRDVIDDLVAIMTDVADEIIGANWQITLLLCGLIYFLVLSSFKSQALGAVAITLYLYYIRE